MGESVVRRPEKYDDVIEALKDSKVFKTYKDVFVFAASLGFKNDKRVVFDSHKKSIDIEIFRGDLEKTIMNSIAMLVTDEPGVIGNRRADEKILIFEEYACGGLEIIKHQIFDASREVDEGILSLILQEKDEHSLLDSITDFI